MGENVQQIENRKYAYSYVRWSSALQTEGSSDQRQANITDETCRSLGLTLVDTIKDKGVSAKDGDNLQANFASLGKVVKKGEYVIVEDWDRVSRAGKMKLISAIYPLVEKGITIVVAKELDDDGNPLQITMKNFEKNGVWNAISTGAGAAKSVNDKQTLMKKAAWRLKKEALARGEKVRIQSLPPWLLNTPKGVGAADYMIVEDKAEIIKKIFRDYTTSGMPIKKIERQLNNDDIIPINNNGKTNCKRGPKWRYDMIKRLLKNKSLTGICDWVKPAVKVFPQIIDDKTFASAAEIIKRNTKMKVSNVKHFQTINIFSGIAFCAKCGCRIYNRSALRYNKLNKQNDRRQVDLICSKYDKQSKCMSSGIVYDRLATALTTILSKGKDIQTLIEKSPEQEPSKLPFLENKLDKCLTHRQWLYDVAKRLTNPTSMHDVEIQKTYDEEAKIQIEIEDEKQRLLGSTPVVEALKTYEDKFQDAFDNPTYELQQLLRVIIDKIILDTENKTAKIFFCGATESIDVILGKKDYTINGLRFIY